MPSLLPGYEYDVFISYRHNDNRSGWVTEFVNALHDELAATLKDPVSIYFDSNPHDGLHETHDVDGSLKEKVKCLVFIPIVSQTYCDPKSFAWQNEFIPFIEFARGDEVGLDVKVSGGNIAKRVLPVRIHDIDSEDQKLFEEQIGGVLRPVDFIYKEAGVNRPLSADEDNPSANSNQTFYKNQINKVANAVKEIVAGLNSFNESHPIVADPQKEQIDELRKVGISHSKRYVKMGLAAISVIAIALLAYLFIPFEDQGEAFSEDLEKSIAVLPFANFSNDEDQEYFSDGLSEELLNLLAKIPELRVIGRTSSFSFKGKNEDLRSIGEKLGVSYLLEGSVRKSGNTLRITAQLIFCKDGSHIWSNTYDRQMEDIFAIQDEIAAQVVNQLKLKIPGLTKAPVSRNLEAYNLMLEVKHMDRQKLSGREIRGPELMERAVQLDSIDARLWATLARSYTSWSGNYQERIDRIEKARLAAEKAIALDPNNAEGHFVLGTLYRSFFWDWEKARYEFEKAAELSKEYTGSVRALYTTQGDWKEAIKAAKASLEQDPLNPENWRNLGQAYKFADSIDLAQYVFKKAIELAPSYDDARWQLASTYTSKQMYDSALLHIYKMTDQSQRSGSILASLQSIYYAMGDGEKAESFLQVLLNNDNNPTDLSFPIARCYYRKGLVDSAYYWVDIAYERKNPGFSLIKAALPFEQSDPRYQAYLKKLNLTGN